MIYRVVAQLKTVTTILSRYTVIRNRCKRHVLPSRHFVHDVVADGEIPEPDITLH